MSDSMNDEAVCRTAPATPGLLKSPHKSNSFRRESISKLPGGKPMNVFIFGLWSSYQIWQL